MDDDSRNSFVELTHSLYDEARSLLAPDKLVLPQNILSHLDTHGITHGVYAWWFDDDLPSVPRDGCISHGDKSLVYVGIAPAKGQRVRAGALTPMKRRLWRNHLCGSVRTSTLRLSLASLLKQQLGLSFWRDSSNRVRMNRDHEEVLSNWIGLHAAVSTMQHENPQNIERELIEAGPPFPVNLSMSGHPFRQRLSDLRRSLGREPTN